ncbi:tRNA (adenosine(37)-N6)-threonylcarbamoyltransferase complex dimerization subunit type 1 TsaB [Desulfobotulus mexicanus]|uniref:tRNA (Adenosine(37)-N6)-threonylcarbamoyltransferase complex dimerization subunit type 1 TsaB n=1 Tax=Desulfobotulus mexicanus TaxID=2586642 RepID=A0A5Q4VHD5_9BACT|nr:tRNA (adenosine(37)-N6)-threonylcarbamoyltransferase complex dimerization subunit type 1 TsaB [Desulfobotulus mexicanus]TYT75590.1 tRNA (adenosine(37)-N6)-threonylcarbamoyltransferase complex dimerization subunit type 1 TsaB [Desulfobotulus mexicanus]
MIILAADTTTASASVCVMEESRILARRFRNPGQTHSRHLLPMIEGVIDDAGMDINSLDALVTTLGPGSFTGLRIGVSTLKGLAMAKGLPMFGFSTLEVIAARFLSFPWPVCVMMDARRNEVYAQNFDVSGNIPRAMGPAVVASPHDVLGHMDGSFLFAGSGALLYRQEIMEKENLQAFWPGLLAHEPDAGEAAFLAMEAGLDAAVAPHLITPLYLRKSDAELQWGKK